MYLTPSNTNTFSRLTGLTLDVFAPAAAHPHSKLPVLVVCSNCDCPAVEPDEFICSGSTAVCTRGWIIENKAHDYLQAASRSEAHLTPM
jgi:hypothetical protein